MSTVRGRGRRLEIEVDRALAAAAEELRGHFAARPAFYRGSRAVAHLGPLEPSGEELSAFRDALAAAGIALDGIAGTEAVAPVAAAAGLAYVGSAPLSEVAPMPRTRKRPATRAVALSDDARSLVADFAGARADLARRRTLAESAPVAAATAIASASVAIPPTPAGAPTGVATLYHRGTLRGGQALHNLGHIVVVGDVNPGAELIASGDIVVVGALRGVAHAGAQGDRGARVVALELAPTQLRIGNLIAADGARPAAPEVAYVDGERIAVAPLGTPIPVPVEAVR